MSLIETQIQSSTNIAIVGISQNPDRDSHKVAKYLQENGYRIIPVNQAIPRILGEASYPNLKSIPFQVDLVNIFKKPDTIGPIIDQSIEMGVKHIWMQDGIYNEEYAAKARSAGISVTMDQCIMREHIRLFNSK
ncbi:MAG: CoA-binding protein [SAR202 cluster bacterium]|nr:CoA-binding protein [SAR202 cluster bacterium]|tara:strand:- start:37010 stop:37411 length:402 start_codon:yes stop_codon:yes gene_type:complete